MVVSAHKMKQELLNIMINRFTFVINNEGGCYDVTNYGHNTKYLGYTKVKGVFWDHTVHAATVPGPSIK
jgi:hypothetical protein